MPRAPWFRGGVVLALGALIVLLALWALRRSDTTDFSAASRQLQVDLSAGLQAVRAAYQAQDATTHAQATFATLSVMNRASIRALLPETDRLIAAISKDGLAAYLSIAIEFAYRLGRIDRPQAQEEFTALAKVALDAAGVGKVGLRPASGMRGLIRSEDRLGYRQYDGDTVEAAGRFAFSEFGRSQFKDGQTPQDLLRSVVMAWECQYGDSKDAPRSEAAKKSCKEFVDVVSKQMADSGQGAVLPAAMELLQGGSRMHTFTCGQRELSGRQFVEAVEVFAACLSSQGRAPRGIRPDGPGLTSYGSGAPTQLPGYTPVGDPQVTVMPGSNPYVVVVQQYENGSGGKATVTNYSATTNGRNESGTLIATDDGKGTAHEERQNSRGDVTYSETRHPDGTTDTFEQYPDGSNSVASTDSDGVTHITHTDSTGNVTTATVKANGDCVGAACKVSMPADESGASDGCHLRVGRTSGPRRANLIDPVGPYIYPLPDSAPGSPLLACVTRNVGGGSTTPRCPPSVVLCLEPPPFGSCACGMPLQGGGQINPAGEACSRIQCPEGSSCDPQTGVCRSFSSGGLGGAFSPGAQPFPRPASVVLRP